MIYSLMTMMVVEMVTMVVLNEIGGGDCNSRGRYGDGGGDDDYGNGKIGRGGG